MATTQLNQLALGVFIFLQLLVAYKYTGGITGIKDYALANRGLGGTVLTLSLMVCLLDVHHIGIVRGYKMGIISLLEPACLFTSTMVLGWWVFPKLLVFKNCYTISDVMGVLYGRPGQWFTVLGATLFSGVMVFSQLKVLAEFAGLLGVPPGALVLGGGALVTLYACWGGQRLVAALNVLQAMVVGLGFVALAVATARYFVFDRGVASELKNQLSFITYPELVGRGLSALFWGLWPSFLLAPQVVQQVLMADNKQQVKRMLVSFACVYGLFRLVTLLAAFKLLFLTKGVLPPHELDVTPVVQKLTPQALLQPLFFLALGSIILSSSTSSLHALAVLLTCHLTSVRGHDGRNQLVSARLIALFLGLVCTGLALCPIAIKSINILAAACIFLSPMVIPFIAGVFGLEGSKNAFIAGVVAFFSSFLGVYPLLVYKQAVVAQILGHAHVAADCLVVPRLAWLISVGFSTFAFFLGHYAENGSFVLVHGRDTWPVRHGYRSLFFDFLIQYSPRAWADKKAALYGTKPYLFCIFMYSTSLIPYTPSDPQQGQLVLLAIALKCVGCILVTFLLLESLWPQGLLKYFNLLYFLSIFYCVPLVNTLISLHDLHGPLGVVNILLGVLLLIVLVEGHTALLMQVTASLVALSVNKLWHGYLLPPMGWETAWTLGFSMAYALLVCIIFAQKRPWVIERVEPREPEEQTTPIQEQSTAAPQPND